MPSVKGSNVAALMIALVIVMGIAVFVYSGHMTESRIRTAVHHIRNLEYELWAFFLENNRYPDDLSEIERANVKDPWGNTYRYYNILKNGHGDARKNKSLKSLNDDFDLYSLGSDGKTKNPLTVEASHDDIIRANNGRFVGIAGHY